SAWSRSRPLIVYQGPNVAAQPPLLAVTPDGRAVDFPPVKTFGEGILHRFMPSGDSLVYMTAEGNSAEFRMLDLATGGQRSLGKGDYSGGASFDILPDGSRIVFSRLRQNSDIYLIEPSVRR